MSFVSFPYCLLQQVLWHLDDDDVLVLGLSCRRLNLLAFDNHFSRKQLAQQLSSSYIRFDLPQEFTAILYFRFALFFQFPPSLREFHISIACFSPSVQRQLYWILSNTHPPSPLGILLHRIETVILSIPHDGEKLDLNSFCKAILSACPSCESMWIRKGSGFSLHCYRRPYISNPRTATYRPDYYKKVLHKSTYPFTRTSGYKIRSRRPKYVTQSVTISNFDALLPPRLSDTLADFLQATVLHFPYGNKLWGAAWNPILSGIINNAKASLRTLSLDPSGIPPTDLVTFLAHLPKLRYLTFHRDCKPFNARNAWDVKDLLTTELKPENECFTFPQLSTVHIDERTAAIIFPERLPKLRSFEISANAGSLFSYTSYKLFQHLAAGLQRQKQTIKPKHGIDVHLWLWFPWQSEPRADMLCDLDGYFRLHFGMASSSPFSCFTSLTLFNFLDILYLFSDTIDPTNYHASSCLILMQYLRLFPSLTQLNFMGQQHLRIPSQVADSDVYHLIRAIHRQCPNVTKVAVCHTYDVKEVLAAHEIQPYHLWLCHKSTSIEGLDQDTLSVIAAFLSRKDLLSLVPLCRALRNWMLPLYLRRCGIFPGLSSSIAPIQFHISDTKAFSSSTLSGIPSLTLYYRSGLSRDPLPALDLCLSPLIHGKINLFFTYRFLALLTRLVYALPSISECARLDFGPVSEGDYVMDYSRVQWTRLVVRLLDALYARATGRLIIRGVGMVRALTVSCADDVRIAEKEERYHATGPSSLQLDVESLQLLAVRHVLIPSLRRTSTPPASLTITGSCTSLLVPPLLDLASALSSTLTELTLTGHDILPSDILSVLCLLPQLEHLALSECTWYYDSESASNTNDNEPLGRLQHPMLPISGSVPDLGRLRSLASPAAYAEFLLLQGSVGPALESLTVQFLSATSSVVQVQDWMHPIPILQSFAKDALPELSTRCPKFTRLILDIFVPTLISLFEPNLNASSVTEGWETIVQLTTSIHLRRLDFTAYASSDDTDSMRVQTTKVLTWWLGLFPRLQSVNFISNDVMDNQKKLGDYVTRKILRGICSDVVVTVDGVPLKNT